MQTTNDYRSFLAAKQQGKPGSGFDPLWLPDWLFDFQKHLVTWAVRNVQAAVRNSAGVFADAVVGSDDETDDGEA